MTTEPQIEDSMTKIAGYCREMISVRDTYRQMHYKRRQCSRKAVDATHCKQHQTHCWNSHKDTPTLALAEEGAERLVRVLEWTAERDGIAGYRFSTDRSDELIVHYYGPVDNPEIAGYTYTFYTRGGGPQEITRAAAVRIAATAKYELAMAERFQPSGVCDACIHGVPFTDYCGECDR